MSLSEPRIGRAAVLTFIALSSAIPAVATPAADERVAVEGVWESSFREGRNAIGNSEWDVAVSSFSMAVHHAEGFESGDPRLVDSLVWLGRALRADRRLHEALPPLLRAVELTRESSRYLDPETAKLLEEAGRARAGVGEKIEAAGLFREAIEVRERTQGPTHPDLVQPLFQLAVWIETREPDEAEASLRRAVRISENARGPNHREVGRLLDELGRLETDRKRYDKAIELYRRALDIERAQADVKPEIVVYRARYLIQAYSRLGRYDETIEPYREMIALTRAHKGERHPDVALELSGLGTALRQTGDLDGAESAFREALEIAEATWGPDHSITGGVRRNLIRVLDERGVAHGLGEEPPYARNAAYPRPSENGLAVLREIDRLRQDDDLPGAIEQAERWLDDLRAVHGEQALEVTNPLRRLAEMLEHRGLFEDALDARLELVEVLSLHVPEENSAHLGALHGVADLLARLGRPEDALGYYESELTLRESLGGSCPEVARLLVRMGATARQVDAGLGAPYFFRAAQAWERLAGPDAPERRIALLMLAQSYVARDDLGQAEALLTELLGRLGSDPVPDPARMIGVLQPLGMIYRMTGRSEEAVAVDERLTALRQTLDP